MVQNLRAYFILYVITIKCIKCMQEKIEFSCMLQRLRLISNKFLEDLSFAATNIKQQYKKLQENFQVWQKDDILLPKGVICHPMQSHSYGLVFLV